MFIKEPDPDVLTVKGAPLASADRQTLLTFVGEILNQLTTRLEDAPIGGHKVKRAELDALRASVTSIPFADLGLPPGQSFDLDVDDTTLNSFASLKAIVKAIQGGLPETARCRALENEHHDALRDPGLPGRAGPRLRDLGR